MGINIFTEDQLKKITNGYKKSIGEGAFGKVFIGKTDDVPNRLQLSAPPPKATCFRRSS
jgi:hypothetical protein